MELTSDKDEPDISVPVKPESGKIEKTGAKRAVSR
jgi:hypothetical protein